MAARGPLKAPRVARKVIRMGGKMRVGLQTIKWDGTRRQQSVCQSLVKARKTRRQTTYTLQMTRLAADCMTARCPATDDFPRSSFSVTVLAEAESCWETTDCLSRKTLMPSLISFQRMHEMLTTPAEATCRQRQPCGRTSGRLSYRARAREGYVHWQRARTWPAAPFRPGRRSGQES